MSVVNTAEVGLLSSAVIADDDARRSGRTVYRSVPSVAVVVVRRSQLSSSSDRRRLAMGWRL